MLGRFGKYTVRRFRPWHMAALQRRPYDPRHDGETPARLLGVTILKGKEVVACIGARELWPGNCEGWVLTSNLVHECPKFFHAVTLRGLLWLERNRGVRRIGAHVVKGWPDAKKWAERLGFTYEGEAPCYGPGGEDFFHYGRVRR